MPLLVAFILAQASQPDRMAELVRRVAAQPPAVRDLIERRAMCNHWGGEEPYDAERRRQIEEAWEGMRCATIEAEAAFLRRHFAKFSETVELLDVTADELGWPEDPPSGE